MTLFTKKSNSSKLLIISSISSILDSILQKLYLEWILNAPLYVELKMRLIYIKDNSLFFPAYKLGGIS